MTVKASTLVTGWKVTTHDLRPPFQGGNPIWSGETPYDLPRVKVDQSDSECAAGWNFCLSPETAFRIAGLWPNGRPSRLWRVESDEEPIRRGNKLRSSSLRIVREATVKEVDDAILKLSAPFSPYVDEMTREQIAWRDALARPLHSEVTVEHSLREALMARKLKDWKLEKFESAEAAKDASWGVSWATWDTWASWTYALGTIADAWNNMVTTTMVVANDAWSFISVAKVALMVYYASRVGWISCAADMPTVGMRDAYRNGLAVVVPLGENKLGWAMEKN